MSRVVCAVGIVCLVLSNGGCADGRRVAGDDAELLFPDGVPSDGVSVTKADSPFSDMLFQPVGPGYICGPAGQQFPKKVTLRLPIDSDLLALQDRRPEDVRIYTRSEGEARFHPLATRADATGLKVEADVAHFSEFQVGVGVPNECFRLGVLQDCTDFACLLEPFIDEQTVEVTFKGGLKALAGTACALAQCVRAGEQDPSCPLGPEESLTTAIETLAQLSAKMLAGLTGGSLDSFTYNEINELVQEAQSALQSIPTVDPTGTWVGTLPLGDEDRPFTVQLHARRDGSLMGYVLGGTRAWTVIGGWVNGSRMHLTLEFKNTGAARTFVVEGTVKTQVVDPTAVCPQGQQCLWVDEPETMVYLVGTVDDGGQVKNVIWNRTTDPLNERRFGFFSGKDWMEVAIAVSGEDRLISGAFVSRTCEILPCEGSVIGLVEHADTGQLSLLWKSFNHESGWIEASFLSQGTIGPEPKLYSGQWQMTGVEGATTGQLPGGQIGGLRSMRTNTVHARKTLALFGGIADDITQRLNFLSYVQSPPYALFSQDYKHFGRITDDELVQLATEVHTYSRLKVEFSRFRNLSTIRDDDIRHDGRGLPLGDAIGVEFHDRRVGWQSGTEVVYRDVDNTPPNDAFRFLEVGGSPEAIRISGNQLEANAFGLPFSEGGINALATGGGGIELPFGVHNASNPEGSRAIRFAFGLDQGNPGGLTPKDVVASTDSKVVLAFGQGMATCPTNGDVVIVTQGTANLSTNHETSTYTVSYGQTEGCEWTSSNLPPVDRGEWLAHTLLTNGGRSEYVLEFGTGMGPESSFCPYWPLSTDARSQVLQAAQTMAYPEQLTEPFLCNPRQGDLDVFPLSLTWTRTSNNNPANPAVIRFVRSSMEPSGQPQYEFEVPDGSGQILVRGLLTNVQNESSRQDGFRSLTFVSFASATTPSNTAQGWFRIHPTSATSAVMYLDQTGGNPIIADIYGTALDGRPSECDDGNPCTTDLETSPGMCVFNPGEAPCFAGNRCSTGDHCENGTCQAGPIDCDDQNPCTVDTCDPATGCQHSGGATGPCDDGNLCTTGDTCANGICMGAPLNCSDLDPCNGTETCNPSSGQCVQGTPLVCGDGNPCHGTFHCQTGVGCVQDSPPPCVDDGNVCNGVETCDPVTGCSFVEAPDCNDNDPCTEDSCNPISGCIHAVHYGPPNCEPVINITFPPRGATLGSGSSSVTIVGTAMNYTGVPLASFTLKHSGTSYTIHPDPGNGSFSQVVSPVHGMNTIVATQLDADGHGAHHVRGYYWSSQWKWPDPSHPTASYVSAGAMLDLAQSAWDDNAPDMDDVASLLELAAESTDLSSYFADVSAAGVTVGGCTWDVSLSGITVQNVSVDLDPQVSANMISGVPEAAMYVHLHAGAMQATVNLAPSSAQAFPCDASQQATMTLALDADGWVGASVTGGVWDVATDWPFGSTFLPPAATVTGLAVVPCTLGDVDVCGNSSANSALSAAVEGAVKDALRLRAPSVLESILNRDRNQTIDLQTLTPQVPSWDITAWARPSLINIMNSGVTIGFDLTAVTTRAPGVSPTDTTETPFLGAIQYGSECSGLVSEGPAITDPIFAGLYDDVLNQVAYVLWEAGALHQVFDQNRLVQLGGTDPVQWGFTELQLDTAPLLAPIAHDCTDDGRLTLQVADTRAHATGRFQGQLFEATVYLTASVHLDLGIVNASGGGKAVSLATDSTPVFADFELTSVSGDVSKNALRDGLARVIAEVPTVMGTSRTYAIPAANVTRVLSDYLGISFGGSGGSDVVLDVVPSSLTRFAGHTIFSATGH